MNLYGHYKRCFSVLLLYAVTYAVLGGKVHADGDDLCATRGNVFWIGTNDNRIFTGHIIDLLTGCAEVVVINSPLWPSDEDYSYARTVSRIKEASSNIAVLGYAWISVLPETNRIGTSILSGIKDDARWDLKVPGNKSFERKDARQILLDVRDPEYRDWVVAQIVTTVNSLNLDGIALDLVFRTPTYGRPNWWCRNNADGCAEYRSSMDDLLAQLKQELVGKKLIINGIFPDDVASMNDQELLLLNVDGAAIEYFGMVPRKDNRSDFERDIESYFDVITSNPGKVFLVFGRGPWKEVDSEYSRSWGRYLYAAYMMVNRADTYFKYHASFQVPGPRKYHSDGVYILPEQMQDYGEPVGGYTNNGCIYSREYTKAYVLLCRHDADTGGRYKFSEPVYLAGVAVRDVTLRPGEAMFLYKAE